MGHKFRFLLAVLLSLAPLAAAASTDGAIPSRDRPSAQALLALGVQYRYGGSSPESGFDCSGLVTHVFQAAWGVLLPRRSIEQSRVGTPVRLRELEPGDLVFYNTRNRPYSHVGIYVGEGHFVHAPRPGARVRIERLANPYWRARFSGARRLEPRA